MGSYFVSTELRPVRTSWKPCYNNIGLFWIEFGPKCWISGVAGFQGSKICKKAKKSVESGQDFGTMSHSKGDPTSPHGLILGEAKATAYAELLEAFTSLS